jgi:hypothetical protein
MSIAATLLVHSHGGNWNAATAKLVRLPELRASFAVLALHESVEQMVTLSSGLQHLVVADTPRR